MIQNSLLISLLSERQDNAIYLLQHFSMNNKFPRNIHYSSRRKSNVTPFSLNLTDSNQLDASLFYSKTLSKMIELDKIKKPSQQIPQTAPFESESDEKIFCRRKDCLDRKFQAIKKLNKSAPNVKMVSPKRVDIILDDQSLTLQKKKQPCIHSARFVMKQPKTERDLLKEFKQLQELRKQLRSRNYKASSHASFFISPVNTEKIDNLKTSNDNPEKTNKSSSLYFDIKTKISKRYNSMFRKYSEGMKDIRAKEILLKDVFSAQSFRKKVIHQ